MPSNGDAGTRGSRRAPADRLREGGRDRRGAIA